MSLRFLRIGIAVLFVAASWSCSKDKDDSPNWSDELKNTVWAGFYQLTSGDLTADQPFSVELNPNGTVRWTDLASSRDAGVWSATGDTLTIIFPNLTNVKAIVSRDSWTRFVSGPGAGLVISEVNRASIPKEEDLIKAKWTGTQAASSLSLEFLAGGEVTYQLGPTTSGTVAYKIEGAGIRFQREYVAVGSRDYAILLEDGTIMRGLNRVTFGLPPESTYQTYLLNKD